MRKNKVKYAYLIGLLLCNSSSFGASEATKKLIHEVLAKYGISAGGKEVCGTPFEPEYNKATGVVKCKNDKQGDTNNCWDAESRLCKECPAGTIVSQKDHITCRQIVCPEGYELVEIVNNECPDGFEIQEFSENNCGDDRYGYDEKLATNNYTTELTQCKNIKIN